MSTTWEASPATRRDEVYGTKHVLWIDFGVRDLKGRAVGCRVRIIEHAEPGTTLGGWTFTFTSDVQSSRDGATYGALAPVHTHLTDETLEQVKAHALKRAEQSRKRQVRQFTKEAR